MAMAFAVDLAQVEIDNLEQGGMLTQKGWYHVTLEDVYPNKHDDSKTTLEFRVKSGPWKGSAAWLHLSDPEFAEKQDTAVRRLLAVAQRLGVVTKDDMAAAKSGGRQINFDFQAAVGWEGFLEITERLDKTKEPPVLRIDPSYLPTFSLTDERVPIEARKAAGVKFAPDMFDGGKQPSTNGKPKANGSTTTATAAAAPATRGRRPTNDDFKDF